VGTHLDPIVADLGAGELDALVNAVDHWLQFAPRLLPSIDGVLERRQWRTRRYDWPVSDLRSAVANRPGPAIHIRWKEPFSGANHRPVLSLGPPAPDYDTVPQQVPRML
jgi:hypothetical protein